MEKSKMSCPNLITYSTLIDGLCGSGRLEAAIDLFEEMDGRLEEAKEIFDEMKGAGLKPDTVIYTTLINSLCRVAELMKLLNCLKR
ncbi:UNVERIFIED_CONTAM: hypothetical protein Scaly_2741400 [Sesamum calycinum]|uniref:Pentatricopeptide repeat-containing protein n=1 Tax=Sesamum calycinum TaxID=2727403 RepID=A0AAW2J130_9LAMI